MLDVLGSGSAVETIKWQGVTQAIVVRATMPAEGYNFVSDPADTMQLGINHYKTKQTVKPHVHLDVERAIVATAEMLYIVYGLCQLHLYDDREERIYETMLRTGDTVMLLCGGHGLDFVEPTKIVEVKQGPYLGPAKDKRVF